MNSTYDIIDRTVRQKRTDGWQSRQEDSVSFVESSGVKMLFIFIVMVAAAVTWERLCRSTTSRSGEGGQGKYSRVLVAPVDPEEERLRPGIGGDDVELAER